MFTLAQLSDPHLAPLPGPRLTELFGKRGLGFINWHRSRKYVHRTEILAETVRDLKSRNPDHIAVLGDLINLSLAAEYKPAHAFMASLGAPADVSLVPGNHDIYVQGTQMLPQEFWGDYMRGDDGVPRLPFLRKRGNLALIALSSAVPTAPFSATGRLGEGQLAGLSEMLQQTRRLFRVVLIHHPPLSASRRYLKRLVDAADLRSVLLAHGAELLLHGHDHVRSLVLLEGPRKSIPAVGVPSASARAPEGDSHAAGYNLFRIDGQTGKWRCELMARQRGADGVFRDVERRRLYE